MGQLLGPAEVIGTVSGTGHLAVYAVVVLAAVLHASWNVLAKAMKDQVVAFWLINATAAIVGAVLLAFGLPSRAAWPYLLASTIIHVGYNVGLLVSYRHGELGQTYTLARGLAPLLVAIEAWVFAGESLSGGQIVGLAVVAGGLTSVVWSRGRGSLGDSRAVLAAVATGVTIATYSVVDGIGVRHSGNPAGYGGALFLAEGVLVTVGLSIARRQVIPCRPDRTWGLGVLGGLLSVAAYVLVLWAQTRASLAVVSALRETSVVAAALFGAFVLHEGNRWRRVFAALIVAAGATLLIIA